MTLSQLGMRKTIGEMMALPDGAWRLKNAIEPLKENGGFRYQMQLVMMAWRLHLKKYLGI